MFLGGNKSTIVWDLKQSNLMWTLRVKIDSWSQGLDENLRARNRRLLIDAYLRLPPRRVFLFANRMRSEFLSRFQLEESGHMAQDSNPPQDNPENVIAKGAYNPSLASIVYLVSSTSEARLHEV